MPVRTLTNRYGRNVVGKFPSLKLNRMVFFESRLECDQIYLLEYDSNVTSYEEQPFVINYKLGDKRYKYTPDFRVVETGERHVLIECKSDRFVDKEANQRKIAAGREWCASHNWEFRVVTEQDTRSGFRLQNIKLLWQFARHKIGPDIKARLYAVLNSGVMLTLDEVAAQLNPADPRAGVIPILHMVFHHELSTFIDEAKITGNSPIFLPQEAKR